LKVPVNLTIASPSSNVGRVTFAFLLSAVVIYFLNLKYTFKKVDVDNKIKVKIAVILAVFTAPYFFFYPTNPNFLKTTLSSNKACVPIIISISPFSNLFKISSFFFLSLRWILGK